MSEGGRDWPFQAAPLDEEPEPGPVPTISVLVTAYNVSQYIGAAVESALKQTFPPYEVIVCDDGSSDDFLGAIEPYRHAITLIRQSNRGPSAAKNAAARLATGGFVVTLDGDDEYEPERLEALGWLASRRPDLDVIATDGYIVEDGRVRGCYHELGTAFNATSARTEVLQHNFLLHPAIRRSRFAAVGGFDERLRNADDWDLCLRLILGGARIGLVDAPLMRYRQRPGQLTGAQLSLRHSEVRLLERAIAEEDLSESEREIAERSLERSSTLMVGAAARPGPGGRRGALRAARDRSLRSATRLSLALAVLSPSFLRAVRRLRHRAL